MLSDLLKIPADNGFPFEILANTREPHIVCDRRESGYEMGKNKLSHTCMCSDQTDLFSAGVAAQQVLFEP